GRELMERSAELLNANGVLHVVMPLEEGRKLIDMSGEHGFFLKRHCIVYGTENSPRRRLMTFGRSPAPVRQEEITIRQKGKFTDEYKSLTGDFYLRFSD
ncbi:MAG: hypothetical protein P8X57_11995, partial [Cyclobacteriaceae bacterium]